MRLVIALFALAATACAHTSAINQIFAPHAVRNRPGCAVAVAEGGRTVARSAYGMASLELGVPLTPDTIFEAGSVSKQFAAAALLRLEEQGKLALDDRVRKYVPELPEAADAVTLRHMLNHTSGLRDWGTIADIGGWPRGTRAHTHVHVLDILSRQRALNYTPGHRYSYSNSGYNLAAIVAERVSGKSLPALTRELFFQPLGMSNSSWRDDYTRVVPRRATAYRAGLDGRYHVDMHGENIYGNCCLMTTAGDLLKWNAHLDRDEAFAEKMERQGILTSGETIEYAHGLTVSSRAGLREVSHSGATGGYRAWLARYPERELSVALLCNDGTVSPTTLGRRVADVFLKPPRASAVAAVPAAGFSPGLYRNETTDAVLRVFEQDGELRAGFGRSGPLLSAASLDPAAYRRVEPFTPSAEQLRDYVGDYTSDEAPATYRVRTDSGRLRVELPQQPERTLEPTYSDAFRLGNSTLIHFTRAGSGRVDGFDLKASFDMTGGVARVERLHFTRR
ncbi:MAG TPA: serine hydrolase domain-containing protein [Thermoanaerobaculia bacterium]|nr:serine hydrolase domain-containing protein [Thermoanaerobaculia bacterium]